uniref:condensation domain-containing protein n=1 Tax=Actinomadura sp. SCN-SB TaxID=3373092 RepID=UPI003752E9AC
MADEGRRNVREQTAARRRELMRRMMAEAGLGPDVSRIEPRGTDGPAPLSYAQQSMWLHHRTFPDSPAYNVCLLVRMSGDLDTGALRESLRALIRRHAILRTVYADDGDGAVQIVTGDDTLDLPPVDCAPEHAKARAEELAARPFDLRRERPVRLELLRLGDREHALVLVVHHIAWDGMTWGSLSGDLSVLYRAALAGDPDPLAPPAVQYADFAVWEQRRPVQEDDLAYWRARRD